MAHNRTPDGRVEDDDTFWNGTPEQIAERLRALRRAGLPTVISEQPAPVRHGDVRALHRRGQAAHRRGLTRPGRPGASGRERDGRRRSPATARASARRVGEPRRVADRGVLDGVAPPGRSQSSARRSRGSRRRRPLADPRGQLADRADRRPGGRRVRSVGDAAERDPTRASSRSRTGLPRVEREHLRQDRRERRARAPAARASRSRGRARGRDPTPVPLAWPDPGQVRGQQQLRARLQVRPVGDRAAAATRRPSG